MINNKHILVLAPHTDDGELGCGGSIAKLIAEGKEVYYAAFSDCKKSLKPGLSPDTLKNECIKATAILGIKASNLIFFDFDVRTFPEYRQPILEELVTLNKSIQPGLVFTPSSQDIHQDHGVIYAESIRAFKNTSLLGYELPWNTISFRSNFHVRLTQKDVQMKIDSLKAYASQAHRNYFKEDFILSLAKVRGVQAGCDYSEVFETIRIISE
jgi:LmbE family N-acetylglucosaminyl deacetylase